MTDRAILISFVGTLILLIVTLYLLHISAAVSIEELLSFELIVTRLISATAAIFTFFLAWIQLGHIRKSLIQQRQSSVRQELNDRDSFSIDLLSNEREKLYQRQIKMVPTLSKTRGIPNTNFKWNITQVDPIKLLEKPELIYAAQEDLAFWEHLSCAVNSGAANYYLIDKMYGGAAKNAYKTYARYIRYRKRGKGGDRFYDQFDRFIDDMLKSQLSTLKITQKTIDKCQERYMDSEELKILKKLKNRECQNFHSFSNLLSKKELHSYELMVYEFAERSPKVRIEYETDFNKIHEELVALYSHVKEKTGFYPPSDDLKYWATTANADVHILARNSQTEQLVGHISVTNNARSEIVDIIRNLSDKKLTQLGFEPKNYPSSFFPDKVFSEVNKLARDHSNEYAGLGRLLYRTAVRYCNEVLQKKVAFSAIAHSEELVVSAALKLYLSEGAEVIGEYMSPTQLTLKVLVT